MKKRTQTDPEITAIKKVLDALVDLPRPACTRVLRYVSDKVAQWDIAPYAQMDMDDRKSAREIGNPMPSQAEIRWTPNS